MRHHRGALPGPPLKTVATILAVGTAVVLAVYLLAISGCSPMVSVQTGTKTLCRYGHAVSEDIRTVKVRANAVDRYAIVTKYVVCPNHREAEQLVADAKRALGRGDGEEAEKLLAKAFETAPDVDDPDGLAARLGVKRPTARPRPATPTTPTPKSPTTKAPSGGGVISPVDLIAALPRSLPGYQFSSENRSSVSASRVFYGVSAPPREVIVQVTYVGSASAYESWARPIKLSYSVSGATLKVGSRTVYFGTDGKRFATAIWRNGGAALQVEAVAKSGAPAKLRSAVVDVIGRMP